MKKPNNAICALCDEQKPLRQSHIIPNFAEKFLKENGVTGFLRGINEPNLRVPGQVKYPLLCDKCENQFSLYEKCFSQQIFSPFHENTSKYASYGKEVFSFLTSLAWRVGLIHREELIRTRPHLVSELDQNLQDWKAFLKGDESKSDNEHHIWFANYDYVDDVSKANGWTQDVGSVRSILLFSLEHTMIDNGTQLFCQGTMPGLILTTSVIPTRGLLDGNNSVQKCGGVISFEVGNFDLKLLSALRENISHYKASNKKFSPKQKAVIANRQKEILDKVKANPDAFKDKYWYKAVEEFL